MKDEKDYIDYDDITVVDDITYLKHNMTLVTGKVRGWHENGQLRGESRYKDGKGEGVFRQWHGDGQICYEGIYKDGELISVTHY